jgi:UDP-N-acetylglucosamine 4,6-dehydratase (inverting)
MQGVKSILITGGTGTFGKEYVDHLLKETKIAKVIVFSRDEFKQDLMEKELIIKYPNDFDRLRFFIGDVRDIDRLKMAFNGVDVVVHAAAMKQVPACEYNPFEAIKTNVIGAQNVIESAIFCNVKVVIALSTDKAVNPVNLYGGTKLLSDKLFVAANSYSAGKTKFSVVRYGNIAGSRGSIIPLAMELAKTKGSLPLTHVNMTRFWMTLDKAIGMVNQSILQANGGEIFVAKNPSFYVRELLEVVCPNCKIEVVGIRPGEKLSESLISKDESRNVVEFEDYFIVYPNSSVLDKAEIPEWEYTSESNSRFLSPSQLSEYIRGL